MKTDTQLEQGTRIVGVEREGMFGLGEECFEFMPEEMHTSQGVMGGMVGRVQGHRSPSCLQSAIERIGSGVEIEAVLLAVPES